MTINVSLQFPRVTDLITSLHVFNSGKLNRSTLLSTILTHQLNDIVDYSLFSQLLHENIFSVASKDTRFQMNFNGSRCSCLVVSVETTQSECFLLFVDLHINPDSGCISCSVAVLGVYYYLISDDVKFFCGNLATLIRVLLVLILLVQ